VARRHRPRFRVVNDGLIGQRHEFLTDVDVGVRPRLCHHKDGPSKASQRLFASLIVIAASGSKRELVIERSRARSGQLLSESGALDAARGDDPYFFLFFA
jgi:hypothetical protein